MYREEAIRGFHYQFVEKLPKACTCPICHLVQREAHQARCCGKIYCKSCLDEMKIKLDNFYCPNCQSSLEGKDKYFRDINMIEMIDNFAIYCTNKDEGCMWKGPLKNFAGHLPKCPYQIIACNNECETIIQRRQLDRHLEEECPRRWFTCPFCKKDGEYRYLTEYHTTTCPGYILKCPNTGCDKRIMRSQIANHRNECTKEIVSCHYLLIGCSARIKREEILSHDQDYMSFHLGLAVKKIHELRAQCPLATDKIPVIKMQNFSQNKEEWISPGFYMSTGSYKMALKISTNKRDKKLISSKSTGNEHNEDLLCDYLSLHLALLPGEHDETLEWPFQGQVIVELLNQKEDEDHMKKVIVFDKDTPDEIKNRVIPPKAHGEWWGDECFIRERHLDSCLNDNDTLYFRISVKIHSKTIKPWLV